MNDRPTIAVIILTFNEEQNIGPALDSISGWADEVFVVDSYSTDRTLEIAGSREDLSVTIVQHPFEDYSKQWNWALGNLSVAADWTLKLDADERVTDDFKKEAVRVTAGAGAELEGIFFRRQFFFMGRPLRFGGISSNFDLRMWRTGRAVFEDKAVNEHALVKGETARLRSHVNHHDHKSLSDWLDKHNRYSSLEACGVIDGRSTGDIPPKLMGGAQQRRMWMKRALNSLPFRNLLYFAYRYVLRLGFLDGRAGLRYAFLHSVYRYWIDLKVIQYRKTGVRPAVIWPGRGEDETGHGGGPQENS